MSPPQLSPLEQQAIERQQERERLHELSQAQKTTFSHTLEVPNQPFIVLFDTWQGARLQKLEAKAKSEAKEEV